MLKRGCQENPGSPGRILPLRRKSWELPYRNDTRRRKNHTRRHRTQPDEARRRPDDARRQPDDARCQTTPRRCQTTSRRCQTTPDDVESTPDNARLAQTKPGDAQTMFNYFNTLIRRHSAAEEAVFCRSAWCCTTECFSFVWRRLALSDVLPLGAALMCNVKYSGGMKVLN
eukprot:gene23832-biopygen22342